MHEELADNFGSVFSSYIAKSIESPGGSNQSAKPLQPTDRAYFTGCMLSMMADACLGNKSNTDFFNAFVSDDELNQYLFSPSLHTFVRSKFARLAEVFILDPAPQTGYPIARRVRIEPNLRAKILQKDADAEKRVPAVSVLKENVLR